MFNVVVWGESYTRKLIDFTIPTLLAPNNIPELVRRRSCEFMFVTTPGDAELIRSAPCFERLSKYLPTVFVFPDFEAIGGTKYALMTAGHGAVCQYGRERGAYGVFLMPEMLISDGSLLYLDRVVRAGKRAVVQPVFRLIEDEVQHLRNSSEINISNRELVSLLFAHAHPEMQSFIVNEGHFSAEPGFVIWNFEDRGVWLTHSIHSQPTLVDLIDAKPETLGHSIDAGDFVRASVNELNEIDVVSDSDYTMMCSLTPLGDVPTPPSEAPPSPASVRSFIHGTPHVTPTHLWYFTHPVVLHSRDIPDDIGACTEISNRFVTEVLAT